jgi:tRNA-Thr(GGU) m(6)t(6)A37 methyltransferase TsaA
MDTWNMKPIGYIHSTYTDRSQIPRGPGAEHSATGSLEILPEFEEGLRDIEGFSHLYILWVFHQSEGFELLATPPTDTTPHGVFATRSPHRPNPIALTVVEVLGREKNHLRLKGIDMLDGTPVLDIKPYLSSIDPEKLKRGWLDEAEKRRQTTEQVSRPEGGER